MTGPVRKPPSFGSAPQSSLLPQQRAFTSRTSRNSCCLPCCVRSRAIAQPCVFPFQPRAPRLHGEAPASFVLQPGHGAHERQGGSGSDRGAIQNEHTHRHTHGQPCPAARNQEVANAINGRSLNQEVSDITKIINFLRTRTTNRTPYTRRSPQACFSVCKRVPCPRTEHGQPNVRCSSRSA